MEVLLENGLVVDACLLDVVPDQALTSTLNRLREHDRVWLYVGAMQTLLRALAERLLVHMPGLQKADALAQAVDRLETFAQGKQWLAALAGDVAALRASTPEVEQLLRALDRFAAGKAVLLMREPEPDQLPDVRIMALSTFAERAPTVPPIPFIDLTLQQDALRANIELGMQRVLHHGQYIMGPEVAQLERRLSEYTGARHCVAVASGTEAMLIALMAIGVGPGDEIITTSFSFIATAEVIALLGARPVFVDIEADTCNIDAAQIEAKVTARTRAIMPVSLYGQPADMDEINAIAARHHLHVIEDAAQSFGASYKGRKSCNLSSIGCTSFFPSKPLGCYGDGGAIFTSDDALATAMREIRVHGQSQRYVHTRIGVGGRMDSLQCAVVLAKLERFDWEIAQRERIGARYAALLRSRQRCLALRPDRSNVYAQFTILSSERAQLQQRLKSLGIPTAVHYPVPMHLQVAYAHWSAAGAFPVAERAAQEVLSLPMGPDLSDAQMESIVAVL